MRGTIDIDQNICEVDIEQNICEVAIDQNICEVGVITQDVVATFDEQDDVSGATLTINGASYTLDANGQAVIYGLISYTDYAYTITKGGYNDLEGTLSTGAGPTVTESVTLVPSTSDIVFHVTHDEADKQGATVKIYDDEEQLVDTGVTDEDGEYTSALESGNTFTYTVELTYYTTAEGEIEVSGDDTEEVELEWFFESIITEWWHSGDVTTSTENGNVYVNEAANQKGTVKLEQITGNIRPLLDDNDLIHFTYIDDGADDRLDSEAMDDIGADESFTITFWWRPDNQSRIHWLMSRYNDYDPRDWIDPGRYGWGVANQSNWFPYAYLRDVNGNGAYVELSNFYNRDPAPDGVLYEFCFFTMVVDRANDLLRFYGWSELGTEQYGEADISSITGDINSVIDNILRIGHTWNATWGMEGKSDEWKLFKGTALDEDTYKLVRDWDIAHGQLSKYFE